VNKSWKRFGGKDVYLDTDNAVNGAIRKIRQVLKDDPGAATLYSNDYGKGYRFIAPVVETPVADADAESEP